MQKFTTNIGLNNNPFNEKNQVLLIFDKIIELAGGTISANRIKIGEYEGKPEPTLVIEFNIENKYKAFEVINLSTTIFEQECIPVTSNDKKYSALIYNYKYEGEKFDFDYNYFIF